MRSAAAAQGAAGGGVAPMRGRRGGASYDTCTLHPFHVSGEGGWSGRHVKKCGSFLNLPKTVPGAFKSYYLLTWRFCRPNLVPPFHLTGGYTKLLRPTKSAFVNAFGYPSATRRRSASLEANAFAAPADASCTARAACARKSGGATGGEGRPLPRGRR